MANVKVLTDPSELPSGYCQMFALAWFLYDFALTIDDEVTYIWSQKLRWNTLPFFMTRYFTGLLLVMSAVTCTVHGFTQTECDIFDWFESIGTFVLFFFVQVILQSRIYVMYGRSRTVLYVNIGLFILEGVVAGIITAFYFGNSIVVVVPSWVLGSCFSERQHKFTAAWAAPLAYETYLASMAVWKLYKEHKFLGLGALEGDSLVELMVRDNVVYFFMIIAAMIVNIFLFTFTGLNPGVSVITVVHAAGAVGGTRIVLSLRRAGDASLHSSLISDPQSITTQFAFGPTCASFSPPPNTQTIVALEDASLAPNVIPESSTATSMPLHNVSGQLSSAYRLKLDTCGIQLTDLTAMPSERA